MLISIRSGNIFKKSHNPNDKKWTQEEIREMTDKLRKRVEIMEKKEKKKQLDAKIAMMENRTGKLAYETMETIRFPFLTF